MNRFMTTGHTHMIGRVIEMEGLRRDGSEFPIELSLSAWESDEGRFATGIIRDISERRRRQDELDTAQRQLYQAEKMASLGKLTAGIAHEINTPIGVISSNADVIARCVEKIRAALQAPPSTDQVSVVARYLAVLERGGTAFHTASERIIRIMSSLRNFTRVDEAEFQRVDIHEGLDSAIVLLEGELGERVAVDRDYGHLPPVACHPGELNQVFMHLLSNAAQAIPDRGRITIRTLQEADHVRVDISDTGVGIARERLPHLFEPGFRSGGDRVKTGMGLFTSRAIIQKHQGTISADSEPGAGSTFVIRLPIQPGAVEKGSGGMETDAESPGQE